MLHHRGPRHHGRRHRGITLRKAMLVASFTSIFATAAVVIGVLWATSDSDAWWREMRRFERFASKQLAVIWTKPELRDQLVRDVARDLEVKIELRDVDGNVLIKDGPPARCHPGGVFRFDVKQENGNKLGSLMACRPGERSPPWRGFVAVISAVSVLWLLATIAARRASKPILELVGVTRRIGGGDFTARPTTNKRHRIVEVEALAESIKDMAERIEQQMKDQRALLAGASHELRTPLGHLRILVELLRANPGPKVIDDIEREVVDMDALVGKLLASSRLDFSMAEKRDVDAGDVARRALERAGESVSKLRIGEGSTALRGDPTLLLGALTNLLENAKTHGQGVERVTLELRPDEVLFVVDDNGPGIPADEEEKVFEPFFHKGQQGSLGLGLALVKRIAEAHGGRAFATTRPRSDSDNGGGRVGFTVLRQPTASSSSPRA